MAKDFNIQTYPTFFLLLLIMLIPFALSVDDIMNNYRKGRKYEDFMEGYIAHIFLFNTILGAICKNNFY